MDVGQNDSKKLVFVFSGMGQQWWAMGRQLLEKEPEFRKMLLEKCDELFRIHSDDLPVGTFQKNGSIQFIAQKPIQVVPGDRVGSESILVTCTLSFGFRA